MGVNVTTNSAQTYVPIATTTLGSNAASYTFNSIPQTYTDLVLVSNLGTATSGAFTIRVGNGSVDTGSNYSRTNMYGDGSASHSFNETNQTYTNTGNSTTSIILQDISYFMNYSNTTTYKSYLNVNGNSSAGTTQANAYLWRSTAAINTIQVFCANGYNLLAGSTFTLYGILAA